MKAIDLFCGIGGIRLGFSKHFNLNVVFSSDIDPNAQKTYLKNFNDQPKGDITKISSLEVPSHDLLMGGFPCQAFSLAGKKLGFEDTRGTLFFEVARIIKEKKPKVIFLENVKGLVGHDKGKTLKVIINTLKELNYDVHYKVLNAANFGLAQKRERIYIVGFNKDLVKNSSAFKFPEPLDSKPKISDILEKNVDINYFVSAQYMKSLVNHKARHAKKGNGFGYQVIGPSEVANTVLVGGMGKERNLVKDLSKPKKTKDKKINNQNLRVMTEREWARLQGFPDSFIFPCSKTATYKQLGNSVAVNVISAIAAKIKEVL